jgi:raffinose/stachyose/melibiose transport system permease protein
MKNALTRPKGWVIAAFLFPAVAIYLFVVMLPMLNSFRYSLYNWTGGPLTDFIGLQNYSTLWNDEDFWKSVKNTLVFTVITVIGQVGLGYMFAVMLISKILKMKEFHRVVIFFPVIVSAVVVGFVWTMIYNKDLGLLNWLLESLHLDFLIRPWLDDPDLVLYTVSVPLIWQYIGLFMVIFMSSLLSIPTEVLEAAEMDGSSGFKKFIFIITPMMYSTIKVAIMLCIAGNMKAFDHVFVMTGGGPGDSSMLMAQYAYNVSFSRLDLGYGSTISVGMLLLSLVAIILSRVLMGGKRYE